MPSHNMHSCHQCRLHHKACKYIDESEVCDWCLKGGYECGPKVDSKNNPKSGSSTTPVTPVTPLASARPRQARQVRTRRSSGTPNVRRSQDATHAEAPASSSNSGPFANSELPNVEYMTGIIAFQILIVRTWFTFLRLEADPHLREQLAQPEVSIHAIISWLDGAFHSFLHRLSDSERLSIEPLHTILIICRTALRNGPVPKAADNTRSRAQASPINMPEMSTLWNGFCQSNSVPGSILACVVGILSELDDECVKYRISNSDWSPGDKLDSYFKTSRIVNLIHQAYLADRRGPPNTTDPSTDIFPPWHIAYRNRDQDIALVEWSKLTDLYGAVDIFDLFGISLPHLGVESEDINSLRKMIARDFQIGHIRGNGSFNLSPLEFAAVTDSADSYTILIKYRQIKDRKAEEETVCLRIAAQAGSKDVVAILTEDLSPLEPLPGPHTEIIRLAIEAKQDDIAFSLAQLESQMDWWQDLGVFASFAETEQRHYLAWRLRNLIPSEPTASQAFHSKSVGGQK